MDFELTNDQQRIFDTVEDSRENIFIGGKPGVGKSVLTRALLESGRKTYLVGAPTGLAALNANGRTLHSLFGIPVSDGILHPTFNKFTSNERTANAIKFGIKTLIIDEISMVRADTLDYVDRCMRYFKQRPEPFGGAQVIAVGDFFQLPPVTKSADAKQLREVDYTTPFAFSSKVWQSFRPLELTEVLRQKGDDGFIRVLHNARTGDITPKDLVLLNDRVEQPDDVRIKLCATNAQADAINLTELGKLPEPTVESHADSMGTWPAFPAETVLQLRIGAQVMIRYNAADRPPNTPGKFDSKIVNGTLGIVREICLDAEPDPYVVVDTERAGTVKIWRKRWERKEKVQVGNDWDERVIASFEQIPLSLAWAISMHKSQGQTFDKVHIDASKIFMDGQLYVALSRCKSLAGITLESRLFGSQFKTNPYVKQYFESITA